MGKQLRMFLSLYVESMSSLVVGREYPPYEGFAQDARNLSGDWQRIGNDMRLALKKEKTPHHIKHGARSDES